MITKILVDNLKCGGCASTITKQLGLLPGINQVTVHPDLGEVDLEHTEQANLAQVKQKLHDLGYPESGTTAGFDKITSNMKSYVSCAIGRFSPATKEKEDDKSHAQK
jgi:copper chaperone